MPHQSDTDHGRDTRQKVEGAENSHPRQIAVEQISQEKGGNDADWHGVEHKFKGIAESEPEKFVGRANHIIGAKQIDPCDLIVHENIEHFVGALRPIGQPRHIQI